MASKYVEDAISAYLASNWSTTPILTENEQAEAPEDGSSFIILQFPAANIRRLSTGTRHYREEGGFRILINVPRGEGTATIRSYGQTLATLFRDVRISGVNCRAPSEPYTDDESDRGNYFTGALVVPFDTSYAG